MTDIYFQDIIDKMRPLLDELQAGSVYHYHTLKSLPSKGVYVFYENGQPMYVGRTGESSKQTMRERIGQHTRDGSRSNQATFAFQLLQEKLGVQTGHGAPLTREAFAEAHKAGFIEQKRRVRKMEVRAVEVEDSVVQTIFEVYAALTLGTTRYNSFDTH